jgi:hypothetical protein
MVYPNSGSIINPNIHSSLSTQIVVKVNGTTVGAIQRLQINQTREMHIHEEIGTDGVVEIHPKNAAKIDLQVTRVVFDELRITEAFARGFVNIQAQRIPFDIQIIDKMASSTREDAVIHIFNNCWFKGYSPTYQADNFIISENANIICEYVTTMRRGHSASIGGSRGIVYEYDTIERTTDVRGQQGRLDSAGL